MDQVARKAANAAVELKKFLVSDGAGVDKAEKGWVIETAGSTNTGDIQFFATGDCGRSHLQSVTSVVCENNPGKYIWENSCLLHCQFPIKLPFYYPMNNETDASKMYSSSIEAAAAKFKGAEFSFTLEYFKKKRAEVLEPVFSRGSDLFPADRSVVRHTDKAYRESDKKSVLCPHFCSESTLAAENHFAELLKSQSF